jgi:tol-pal system protein YbgF
VIRRAGVLLGLFVLGGCATRGDVQRLENAVLLLRAESERRDSAHIAALRDLGMINKQTGDSVAAIRAQIAQIKGDLSGELYSIQQQLVQVQELTGQSQQRLTELRTQLEAREEQIAVTTPPNPTRDSAVAAAAASTPQTLAPGAPTADQIYQASLAQLRKGSLNTARTGFRELLRLYPQSPRSADALYFVGESYAAERPDSALAYYQQVVDRFTTSPRAATALYKMGLLAEQQRDNVAARRHYQKVVQSYPQSDEAALARDRLNSLGR